MRTYVTDTRAPIKNRCYQESLEDMATISYKMNWAYMKSTSGLLKIMEIVSQSLVVLRYVLSEEIAYDYL